MNHINESELRALYEHLAARDSMLPRASLALLGGACEECTCGLRAALKQGQTAELIASLRRKETVCTETMNNTLQSARNHPLIMALSRPAVEAAGEPERTRPATRETVA